MPRPGRGPPEPDSAASRTRRRAAGIPAYYLGHIDRPLVSIHNLCIQGVGDERYPNIPWVFSVRTEDLPAGVLRVGESPLGLQSLRKVSTTAHATHTGQYENLLRPRGVVRAASLQFELIMGGQALRRRKCVSAWWHGE